MEAHDKTLYEDITKRGFPFQIINIYFVGAFISLETSYKQSDPIK